MFSIVVPLYNKELSVQNTLESVINQTFPEFEIIVVNDGSSDNSVNKVNLIEDNRIRIIHQENQGVSAARNKGIKLAKYEWIAFLDADDLWEPNHLEEMSKLIRKYPLQKFFSTSFVSIQSEPITKPVLTNSSNEEDYIVDDYFQGMLEKHLVCVGSVVMHKSVIGQIGDFNETLSIGEDLDCWARIGKYYSLVKSDKITFTYRLDAENRSIHKPLDIQKSIFSKVVFNSNMTSTEYVYYGRLIINKTREFARLKQWKNCFYLLKTYNYKLVLVMIKYFKLK